MDPRATEGLGYLKNFHGLHGCYITRTLFDHLFLQAMKPCKWFCRQTCYIVILLYFMLLDEVLVGNFKDAHCLVMARANYESTRNSVVSPCVTQRCPFQKHVTNYAADIALCYEKICSVSEGSLIQTKYRKTLAVFLHGCTKGNSVYGSALQCVVLPLTQSQISATKLRTRVARTFETCRGSIGR